MSCRQPKIEGGMRSSSGTNMDMDRPSGQRSAEMARKDDHLCKKGSSRLPHVTTSTSSATRQRRAIKRIPSSYAVSASKDRALVFVHERLCHLVVFL